MKYRFIDIHRSAFAVEKMCRTLGVSRSGYYSWRCRPESIYKSRNRQLLCDIEDIVRKSRWTYGSPRVIKELQQRGIICGKNRVTKLMNEHGITVKTKRKYKKTTKSEHKLPIAKDLLCRDFSSPAPNSRWASDITYLHTHEGWLYLTVVLDIYSRKVVGWTLSSSLDSSIAVSALNKALANRKPTSELIFHSDRGIQYASANFRAVLNKHGILQSMGHKGDCYDNAIMESFFSTLKAEIKCFGNLDTKKNAELAIFEYIEVFYNRQRIHSTINYKTPEEFEKST